MSTLIRFLLWTLLPLTLSRQHPQRLERKGYHQDQVYNSITPNSSSSSLDSASTSPAADSLTISNPSSHLSTPSAVSDSVSATAINLSVSSPATSIQTANEIAANTSVSATAASSAASSPSYTYTPPSISLDKVKGSPFIRSHAYKRLTKLLPTVLTYGVEISTHSWELGAMIESLLEVYNPGLSVFDYNLADCGSTPWAALQIAVATLGSYNWTGCPSSEDSEEDIQHYLTNSTSPVPLVLESLVNGDGALGDPCAPAPGTWVLAKYADRESEVRDRLRLEQSAQDYAWVVGNQLAYLRAGTTSDIGTISQRGGYFELWSDMGYMIPPFPAFIGLETADTGLLQLGIDQWVLESSALLDTTTSIFRHVHNWDARLWATGNAWMTYGAVRVLASIYAAGKPTELGYQVANVQSQLTSIFDGLFGQLDNENLVPNYMLQSNATLGYGDAAGTALITAAYYRFLRISPLQTTLTLTAKAERAFDGVTAQLGDDGWLKHVVDPMGTNGWVVLNGTLKSPEGQSFLGHMWAARTAAGI